MCTHVRINSSVDYIFKYITPCNVVNRRAVAHSPASQAMAGLVFVIGASAKVAIIILCTGPIPIVY